MINKGLLQKILEVLLPSHTPFNPKAEEGKKLLAIWGLVLETLPTLSLFEGTFYYILKYIEEDEVFRREIYERLEKAREIIKEKD